MNLREQMRSLPMREAGSTGDRPPSKSFGRFLLASSRGSCLVLGQVINVGCGPGGVPVRLVNSLDDAALQTTATPTNDHGNVLHKSSNRLQQIYLRNKMCIVH